MGTSVPKSNASTFFQETHDKGELAPMNITYSEKVYNMNRRKLLRSMAYTLIILAISGLYFIYTPPRLHVDSIPVIIITFFMFLVVVAIGLKLYRMADRYAEATEIEMRKGKLGMEGEGEALKTIQEVVGTNYQIFPNWRIPTGGDIDCIILGAKGIFLVEVKKFTQPLTFYPINFLPFEDPRSEAKRHAKKLREFLVKSGYDKPFHIHTSVLFVNPNIKFYGSKGVFSILGLPKFASYFQGVTNNVPLASEDIARIATFFNQQ